MKTNNVEQFPTRASKLKIWLINNIVVPIAASVVFTCALAMLWVMIFVAFHAASVAMRLAAGV